MPVLISSIMAAMPKLGNVVALCGFIFLVFGIVGMELFKGTLHYRCATPGLVETPGHPRRLQAVLGGDLSGTNASMVGAVEGDSWSDGSLALLRTVAAAASPWQHLSGRSLKAGAGGGGRPIGRSSRLRRRRRRRARRGRGRAQRGLLQGRVGR